MAFSSFFSLNFTLISSTIPTTKCLFNDNSYLPPFSFQFNDKKRGFQPSSAASIPYQTANLDHLVEEFSGNGVTFEGLGDSCIAKMRLENGSTATLMLPSGLITSYKARMWHGGTVELLQTSVFEKDGCAAIQGGVSSVFDFESEGQIPWSPSSWSLQSVNGNPQDSIQVELLSTDADDMVEVRCIISFNEDTLSSQLVVSNLRSSPVHLTGAIISHLTVSSPEATYACGLEGSDFYSRPMLRSNCSIIPPVLDEESPFSPEKILSNLGLKGLLLGSAQKNPDTTKRLQMVNDEESEGEEKDNYKNLTETMSRIYTSAPRGFTLIDRGRRNSVIVGRDGFDELYVFSPGSSHESYGKYSYICVGQSALLKPVVIGPGKVWRGAQHLHNPNLG